MDLGHLSSFPFMNLNETDRIFGEHEMYRNYYWFGNTRLGENSIYRDRVMSVMTFEKGQSYPSQGSWIMFKCATLKSSSHRSCNIILFCFFHWSLKSVENSCQTENRLLGETSFSPAFGFTEKDTLNSKKLRTEKKTASRPNDYNMRVQKPTETVAKPGSPLKIAQVNLGIIWLFKDKLVNQQKQNKISTSHSLCLVPHAFVWWT